MRTRQIEFIFSQGDPADAVFYIQSGKVKSRWFPRVAKKPYRHSSRQEASLAKVAWLVNRFGWREPAPIRGAALFG